MDYQKIVKTIIEKFKLDIPPIIIADLAKELGITDVLYEEFEDTVSGVLVTMKDNHSYIVINSNQSENRQRFSIAHELAHFLLHKNSADVFVDSTTYFRSHKSSTGEDIKEVQANRLAAELLMPEEFIRQSVGNKKIDSNDESEIDKLSCIYGVSAQAMTIRLDNLKLLHKAF